MLLCIIIFGKTNPNSLPFTFRTGTVLTYYHTVLNVIRPLVTKIYAQLRRDRAECCEKHDPECDCTIWRFPKIYWHTLDELEEKLGAEVVKY
jgi:hypothetical protein